MINLIVASINFAFAVYFIDYNMTIVALNVGLGVLNLGVTLKPTTNA